MSHFLIKIIALSIGLPAIIGLIRFKRIDFRFVPFILLMWVGLLNELLNWIVLAQGYSNAINSNIYYLIDSLLLLLFFQQNELIKGRTLKIIGVVFVATWIIELFFFRSIHVFSSYFILIYSSTMVIMSIDMINKVFFSGSFTGKSGPLFLICTGLILFYTCATLIEIFWIWGLNGTSIFRMQVYRIMAYINLTTNLIYAIALLWIPRKQESLLQ